MCNFGKTLRHILEHHRYFLVHKPRGMVSQFISTHSLPLLGDLNFNFPDGTHAIGRLDADSEGLLLLTTDKRVTRLLFLDAKPHARQYLVMVQNEVSAQSLQALRTGISIKIKNGEMYTAKPEAVERVTNPLALYPFATDEREKYAHTWLLITLTEGKYRQVRKMVLAIRHRCLRLVRLSISDMLLENLAPGEVREICRADFFGRLAISNPEKSKSKKT